MKQRLLVALLTVVVFGAGFAARVLTEGDATLPPPPAPLGAEFLHGASAEKKPAPKPAFDRAQLIAEVEKNRAQIEAYRARIEALDEAYDKGFVEILNPEQHRVYEAKQLAEQKHKAAREAKVAAAAAAPPLSDEEIAKLRQRPFESAFWKISIAGRLEQTTAEYKLDASQQTRLRELLVARRNNFIALVDATPPPTFKLAWLAASVKRLVDPTQAAPAAPAQATAAPTLPAK